MEEVKKENRGMPSATYWKNQLQISAKELEKFHSRGRRVIKKFMGEENSESNLSAAADAENFPVFWSNVGILKAALYAIPPKPVVKREFDDFMDQEGRVAAVMMERLLAQPFAEPDSLMNSVFKQIVEDRLLPGLGQCWLRYEVETAEEESEEHGGEPTEYITEEEVCADYVYWEDFLWQPSRVWSEVTWVARRCWLSRSEFRERFPDISLETMTWQLKPTAGQSNKVTPENNSIKKTEIFEVWNKVKRDVHWISKSHEFELDHQQDPLGLDNFFPCPKPLMATTTTSSTVPKADYLMTQAQYRRLDNLTRRISLLETAIQASGVYDKTNKELSQILNNNVNKMIPVDNWAMFAEKGGMKGTIDWFPLEMITNALDKLRDLKSEAKAELYELTNISDIMRGASAPRETAAAQTLKAQYSSVTLQYRQNEVAEFIQEVLRIKGEIIANHFQPETIIKNSLIELTPDAEYAQAAVGIIKDHWAQCYRTVIYADTLSIPDYNAERQGRTEFITATGQFVSQIIPLLQMEPTSAPFFMQLLQWAIASFRSAQSIEGVFTKAITEMTKSAQNPKPEKPDPALIKANAEVQALQMKTKASVEDSQAKTQAAVRSEQIRTESQVKQDMVQAESQAAQNEAQMNASVQKTQTEISIMVDKAVAVALEHRQKMRQDQMDHTQDMSQKSQAHALAQTLRKKEGSKSK